MEELKPFAELNEPDARQHFFALRDPVSGKTRPLQAEDIYERAEGISLHAGVPEDIRSHFATAQNLLAYSWFYYPFNVTAELHGYVSVEFALKRKYPDYPRASFKTLLAKAISEGLVKSEGFTYGRNPARERYPPEINIPTEIPPTRNYVEDVAEAMRSLRNSLAHGTATLHMKGGTVLLVCAELINQLFPPPSDG